MQLAITGPIVSVRGKRQRPITPREKFKLMQYEMDFRFVREVEYLEREGRSPGRVDLELSVGLEKGGVSTVRAGKRSIGPVQLRLLFELYRGDMNYVIFGAARDKERTNPYISGYGRIDKFEPYIHRYQSIARWRVGARSETQPEYFPADPNNEHWTPSTRDPLRPDGRKGPRIPRPE